MRPLARRTLCAALLTALSSATLSSASATDMSGALADYLLGKVPPSQERADQAKGVQIKLWLRPQGVRADMLMFLYPFKLGPDYWMLMIYNPGGTVNDYLGTTQLSLMSLKEQGGKKETLYRVNGGRFTGYMVAEMVPTNGDARTMVLFPPKMAGELPKMFSGVRNEPPF